MKVVSPAISSRAKVVRWRSKAKSAFSQFKQLAPVYD